MAENGRDDKPKMSREKAAILLVLLAIFMYVSIMIKIVVVGP